MKHIYNVEVFNCYVVVVPFGRRVSEAGLRTSVCLWEGVSVCCALREAVISSIPAALQQSDNPGHVNLRTAAAAVSTHNDSTHSRHSAHIRWRVSNKATCSSQRLSICKKKKILYDHIIMVISPCYRFPPYVCSFFINKNSITEKAE